MTAGIKLNMPGIKNEEARKLRAEELEHGRL